MCALVNRPQYHDIVIVVQEFETGDPQWRNLSLSAINRHHDGASTLPEVSRLGDEDGARTEHAECVIEHVEMDGDAEEEDSCAVGNKRCLSSISLCICQSWPGVSKARRRGASVNGKNCGRNSIQFRKGFGCN